MLCKWAIPISLVYYPSFLHWCRGNYRILSHPLVTWLMLFLTSWFVCAKWLVISCLLSSFFPSPFSPFIVSFSLFKIVLPPSRSFTVSHAHNPSLSSTAPHLPLCRSYQQVVWPFLLFSSVQIILQGAVTWDVVPHTDFSILSCFDENPNQILVCTYHRITEWFGLGGTFKGHRVQPPAMNRDTFYWIQGHPELDQY